MSRCTTCDVRLDGTGRELPLSGPEITGEGHNVQRCMAFDLLRATVAGRLGERWQVWVEPRPGALRVTASRRVDRAGRVTASAQVADWVAVGASQPRGLYVAETAARNLELRLMETA